MKKMKKINRKRKSGRCSENCEGGKKKKLEKRKKKKEKKKKLKRFLCAKMNFIAVNLIKKKGGLVSAKKKDNRV